MMRISTRGRYALRAMVDVALHGGKGPVSRQDIATRQRISADYVAQLFRDLRTEGFVKAIRGPGGGYLLARDPATISAEDVLRVVEGPLAIVPCTASDPSEGTRCNQIERCATQLLWNRLSAVVTEFLGSVTLQDLCDEAQKLERLESHPLPAPSAGSGQASPIQALGPSALSPVRPKHRALSPVRPKRRAQGRRGDEVGWVLEPQDQAERNPGKETRENAE